MARTDHSPPSRAVFVTRKRSDVHVNPQTYVSELVRRRKSACVSNRLDNNKRWGILHGGEENYMQVFTEAILLLLSKRCFSPRDFQVNGGGTDVKSLLVASTNWILIEEDKQTRIKLHAMSAFFSVYVCTRIYAVCMYVWTHTSADLMNWWNSGSFIPSWL